MYLGLVLIVMIVTGSYILLSMQKTEIDKAKKPAYAVCPEGERAGS